MVTVKSIINFVSQAVPSIISAVQGDSGREVLFTPSDFKLPSGATAEYHIRQPSGNVESGSATVEDGKILVGFTEDDTAEIGDSYGQVQISSGGLTVTSFDFILAVCNFRGN